MMPKTMRSEIEDVDVSLSGALERGDHDLAIEILIGVHGNHVYRYCRRMLGNSQDVEDVSQLVFVQAFQGINELSGIRNPRAWLLAIARHRCLDRLKAIRRRPQVFEEEALDVVVDRDADDALSKEDPRLRKALDDCLDRLDDRSRAALILRFHEDLSYDEISTLTSDTAAALRVRIARALPALRRCLERKGVTP
jgi:RNA polymerase sigma factor (sigma-70 family)